MIQFNEFLQSLPEFARDECSRELCIFIFFSHLGRRPSNREHSQLYFHGMGVKRFYDGWEKLSELIDNSDLLPEIISFK